MKIAICISGMPRTFKKSYISFKEKILNPIIENGSTYDIYISTWDKQSIKGTGRDCAHQDDGSLKEFEKLYDPIIFEIERYTDNTIEDIIRKFNIPDNIKVSVAMMLYKIYMCNKLLTETSHYDLVFRTRSDLEYKNIIYDEMLKSLETNSLFIRRDGGNTPSIDGICIWDQIAFGPPSRVTDFCDTILNINEILKTSKDNTPEEIIYTQLINCKTPLNRSYIQYNFIRDYGIQRII